MSWNDQQGSQLLCELNEKFGNILHPQLTELSASHPLVIFLDGEGVTRDHTSYHLLDLSYARAMVAAAHDASNGIDAEYLALLDEISIVFPDPSRLFRLHHYQYHDEVTGFFVQDFQTAFRRYFHVPTKFHIKAYNIPDDAVLQYFVWRRERSKLALYQYIAKEYLPPSVYCGKDAAELQVLLKQRGLLTGSKEERLFLDGIAGKFGTWQDHRHPSKRKLQSRKRRTSGTDQEVEEEAFDLLDAASDPIHPQTLH